MRNHELIHFPIILLVGRWSYKDLAKVLCQRFFQQWSAAPSSPRWLIFLGGKSPFIWRIGCEFVFCWWINLPFPNFDLGESKHKKSRSLESFHQVVIVMTMLTWGFEGAFFFEVFSCALPGGWSLSSLILMLEKYTLICYRKHFCQAHNFLWKRLTQCKSSSASCQG